MECLNCKNELKINSGAYRNLESYHQGGGTVLVSSECCNSGFLLKSRVTFSITEYTGDKKEDDWGNKIVSKK
jgi:hypothetical protein